MATYSYGSGWNQLLTADQLVDLQGLLDQQRLLYADNNFRVGLGLPLYATLLNDISDVTNVNGHDVYTPKAGVDPAVYNWIFNAVNINNQNGFAADFIATYTVEEKSLRDGAADVGDSPEELAQKASNNIAFNLIDGLEKSGGQLPSIEGLGVIDAGAAASAVFTDTDTPDGDYAGWAGTLLFPYLGVSSFYDNWLLNTEPFSGTQQGAAGAIQSVTYKHEGGTYDLISSIEAAQKTSQDLSDPHASKFNLFDAIEGVRSLIGGPQGAIVSNQAPLAKTTQSFFQTYYGLAPKSEWIPSSEDMLFSQTTGGQLWGAFLRMAFGGHQGIQYVAGTVAPDSDLSAPDDDRTTVMTGGSNNDVIYAPLSGDALIDGGGGNDTIYGGGGTDLMFGGDGNNTLYAGDGAKQILVGGTGDTAAAAAVAGNSTPDSPAAGNNTFIVNPTNAVVDHPTNTIMIGGAGNDIFNFGAGGQDTAVIWGNGGNDTLNDLGGATIWVVNAPDASLQTVENLDLDAFAKGVENSYFPGYNFQEYAGEDIFIINPTPSFTLTLNGHAVSSLLQGYYSWPSDPAYNPIYYNLADPNNYEDLDPIGSSSGQFGLPSSGTTRQFSLGDYQSNSSDLGDNVRVWATQPTNNLAGRIDLASVDDAGPTPTSVTNVAFVSDDYVTDTITTNFSFTQATGAYDTLLGTGFREFLEIDGANDTIVSMNSRNTLSASGSHDLLEAGTSHNELTAHGANETLSSSGSLNLLTDVSGHNTLISTGTNDTLIGSENGTTLIGSGTNATALYQTSGTTVDLRAGIAGRLGTDFATDVLIGITNVVAAADDIIIVGSDDNTYTITAAGSNDTLIAGAARGVLIDTGSSDTLVGSGTGSTLDASQGSGSLVTYTKNNVVVDLSANTAYVNGSSLNDVLIGVHAVSASGTNDTLIGGGADTTLIGNTTGNTLIGGSGQATIEYTIDNVYVDLAANTASSSTGFDTLSDVSAATVSGTADTIAAGSASFVLTAAGASDVLIGGSGASTLQATGQFETLLGGSGGNSLVSSGQHNTLVAQSTNNTLITSGTSDTLLASAGADHLVADGATQATLVGNVAGSTLQALNGADAVAAYALDNVTVNLETGLASIAGTGSSDVLIGINAAEALGVGDTLQGSTGVSTLISSGAGNTLVGGGTGTIAEYGGNGVTVDLSAQIARVNGSSAYDTLVGISNATVTGHGDTLIGGTASQTLQSSGSENTLIAGTAAVSLVSSGTNDTLFGNLASSVLQSDSQGTVVAYSIDGVTVDLDNGTASGSSGTDTLSGFVGAAALGSGDTLISLSGNNTLFSNANGNTLRTSSNTVEVLYSADDMLIDLPGGTAGVQGSGRHDTLIGVQTVDLTGVDGTIVSNGSGNTLISASTSNTLEYSNDDVLVDLAVGSAAVAGDAQADQIIGLNHIVLSGTNDVARAGTFAATLVASGTSDTLEGQAAGSTLIASGASSGALARYTKSFITIDLAAGRATSRTGTYDSLIGISAVDAAGQNEIVHGGTSAGTLSSSGSSNTLTAGTNQDTLLSTGANNTLIAGATTATLISTGTGDTLVGSGAGSTLIASTGIAAIAEYDVDHAIVDLGSGSASIAGSGASDTLIGLTAALVTGSNDQVQAAAAGSVLEASGESDTLVGSSGKDTLSSSGSYNLLIGGAGNDLVTSSGLGDTLMASQAGDTLSSSGVGNTLIAQSGADTLVSTGGLDILVGNGQGSKLVGTGSFLGVATYSSDNTVVDLSQGTATISGSSLSDTLVGFEAAWVSGSNDTLVGSNGGDQLTATGSDDIVLGGAGNDTLFINSGNNTFYGGDGQNTFTVESAVVNDGLDQPQNLIADFDPSRDVIDLSHVNGVSSLADLIFDTVSYGGASYLEIGLGSGQAIMLAGVAETQLGSANFTFKDTNASDTIVGNSGNNLLVANSGNDTLVGGGGSDTYRVGSSFGQDVIQNNASDGVMAAMGEVDFGAGIADQDLWFQQVGNDLQIDKLGTQDSVTVSNWYGNDRAQVQTFALADGMRIDSQIAQLVSAMATYSAANPGFDPSLATSMPTDAALTSAIGSSWHT